MKSKKQKQTVYAVRRPNSLSTFPGSIWANMGKNKNGWEEVTEEQYKLLAAGQIPTSSAVEEDLAAAIAKRDAAALAEAVNAFGATGEEALAIAGKMQEGEETEEVLEEVKAGEIVELEGEPADDVHPATKAELVQWADEAYRGKDYESSLSYFLQAQELGSTKYIDSKIKACNKKLGYED